MRDQFDSNSTPTFKFSNLSGVSLLNTLERAIGSAVQGYKVFVSIYLIIKVLVLLLFDTRVRRGTNGRSDLTPPPSLKGKGSRIQGAFPIEESFGAYKYSFRVTKSNER